MADTFTRATEGGVLTLSPGQAGDPAVDGFIATLPGQSLVLRQTSIQLSATRLVVSGALGDIWALPGMRTDGLRTGSATITYAQDNATAPVTAALSVTATLVAGANTLDLTGSLTTG